MTRTTVLIALWAALAATGCLQKDTTSTIYLRPDGSFDWVVLEQNVRSDETDPAKRNAEEHAYTDAVARDQHAVAEGFRALGAQNVRTRVVRGTRPYAVVVDARFDSLTSIFESMLAGCDVPHEIGMTTQGGITTWRLWADVGPEGEKLQGQEDCGAAFGGLDDALDFTVVLESGTFTGATGFKLDGTDKATVDDDATASEALKKNNGQVVFSLSWKSHS